MVKRIERMQVPGRHLHGTCYWLFWGGLLEEFDIVEDGFEEAGPGAVVGEGFGLGEEGGVGIGELGAEGFPEPLAFFGGGAGEGLVGGCELVDGGLDLVDEGDHALDAVDVGEHGGEVGEVGDVVVGGVFDERGEEVHGRG